MAESAILDLSGIGTKAGERRFMLAFLTALYRKTNRDPVHLVFDEADMWAPQRLLDKEGEAAKLLGMMETIVRRGRIKGFIPWLITQRPAVISKDIFSQMDGLAIFKLVSPQDRGAIGDWVSGQANKTQWKTIDSMLATRGQGEAVFWLPGRDILGEGKFPMRQTFDSSRTPKRGEARPETVLAPLDLSAIRSKLADVEKEAKANDPAALRKEIERLKREKVPSGPTAEDIEKAAADIRIASFRAGWDQGATAAAALYTDAAKALLAVPLPLSPVTGPAIPFTKPFKASGKWTKPPKTTIPIGGAAQIITYTPADDLPAPLQTIINALRWWQEMGIPAPSMPQAAFMAGYSHKSGTWGTYVSRLRSLGLIAARGLQLTPEGLARSAGPTEGYGGGGGAGLRQAVLAKLDGPLAKIMRPILDAYPEGLTVADAAAAAGYSPASGTWGTYLSRLRSLDLIGRGGVLKAQEWLFP